MARVLSKKTRKKQIDFLTSRLEALERGEDEGREL